MGTVHFSLGENLGKRLTEIAQEKLIYNCDINAAIQTFTKSLCGFPEDMAIRCLSGTDLKLTVVGDEIEVVDTPIEDYPKVDFGYIFNQWTDEFYKIYRIFERPLLNHTNFTKRTICIPYSVRDIILGYDETNPDAYEYLKEFIMNDAPYEITEDRDFERGVEDIELYKMFREWKELFLKRAKVIEFVLKNRLVEPSFRCAAPQTFINTICDYQQKLQQALYIGIKNENEHDDLDRFIDAAQEINEIKELKPVENYEYHDAIWLAPDGTMYGLCGEISNMLHNTMAEMLCEQGIIKPDTERQERNPYIILEEDGWVKIHGDWVMFEPNPFDKPKQFMTEAQVKSLCKYLDKNCHMLGKFGIQHEMVLTYQLKQMDKFAINKLYEL